MIKFDDYQGLHLYDIDYSGSFYQSGKTGRYFTIKKEFILQKFDEMMN